jgi:MFS family permease
VARRPLVYIRSLKADLPRGVYILQAGLVLNAFGNGAANPFVVLYLHDVRHVPLGVAGLAAATSATAALLSALVAGSVADRSGAAGAFILGAEPRALWPVMASLCALGAIYALRLERRLPEAVRLTPRRTNIRHRPEPVEPAIELPAEG